MLALWIQDLEALEAINQGEGMRDLVLRMAGLVRGGRLGRFIDAIEADADLDQQTKTSVYEIAREKSFLLAFEDYLHCCRYYH